MKGCFSILVDSRPGVKQVAMFLVKSGGNNSDINFN